MRYNKNKKGESHMEDLKTYRVAARVTQEEIASLLGVSVMTIYRRERDPEGITIKQYKEYIDAIDILEEENKHDKINK